MLSTLIKRPKSIPKKSITHNSYKTYIDQSRLNPPKLVLKLAFKLEVSNFIYRKVTTI